MRIGILTFHRAYNYGAVLQCYALQQYLISLGHEVEIIDYRQKWVDACFKPFSWYMFKYNMKHPRLMYRYLMTFVSRYIIMNKRKQIFNYFASNYLNVSEKGYNYGDLLSDNIDAYVIGSDQLWGISCLGGQPDSTYLGLFKHKSSTRVIGYAISSDDKSIEYLYEKGVLGKALSSFDALSFREMNVADKVRQLFDKQFPITVDPTLLEGEKMWSPLINNCSDDKKYVVVYQVRGIKKNKKRLHQIASEIASRFGAECSVLDLSDMMYPVSEFVSLIKHAKFVITTSFHATVFSILFKTPFYAIKLNDGRDNRYVNLCTAVGLGGQCIDLSTEEYTLEVDFSNTEIQMTKISEQSKIFIVNNL